MVYFLFGRGKKKKESPKTTGPATAEKPRAKNLQDILRELGEEIQEQTEMREAGYKPEVQAIEERSNSPLMKEQSVEDYKDVVNHNAETGKTMEFIRDEMEKGAYHPMEDMADVLEVDLRQAVIYDAILNRPYD
jgi:hypothetical protein